MQKKFPHNKEISLKFVVSVFSVLVLLACYISYPSNTAKNNNKNSYEELLEYNTQLKKEETYYPAYIREKQEEEMQNTERRMPYIQQNYVAEAQKHSLIGSPVDNILLYNKLLDELAQYPPNNETSVKNITERLLLFKGYPSDTIKIVVSNADVPASQSMYQYVLASFNFVTGEMYISNELLYQMSMKEVIAVLAHELDHFDKIAQVCKSIGLEQFNKIYTENGISGLDLNFWHNASYYANIEQFETGLYTNALKRFLMRKDLEQVSSYADFYRFSENMRNPLEKSAYKESNYVFNHFKIPIVEGNMKHISNAFDKIDSAIYKLVNDMQIPPHERIAMFDYFYANAINEIMPEYKREFINCITNKNGDLTSFWLEFENSFSDFYKNAKVTRQTLSYILSIFNNMQEQIRKGVTNTNVADAIFYKISTLKSNVVYPNALENLKRTAINYLQYTKQKGVENPEQELNAILTLLCIENKLYTNNTELEISLSDLVIPIELVRIYNIQKHNRFSFVYNNSAFQQKNIISSQENDKLISLLNQTRINVRVKQAE